MLLGDQKVEEAAVRFLRAIEVEPSHGVSYFGLGKAIYHLNNPTQGECPLVSLMPDPLIEVH